MPEAGKSTPVLDEFLAADIVVIGAPMYNSIVPSQIKAWINRILIPGKTFSYGEAGLVGLAGDKRIIVAVSRGNLYRADAPSADDEHVETYLKSAFGLIGVTPEFVIADGIQVGPEQREVAMAEAEEAISALAT